MENIFKEVLTARVYDVAQRTSLDFAKNLSAQFGCNVLLKREDLQPVFSFKLRGAYNKVSRLSQSERRKGVICASAGNHAQGVALSAHHLGISAVVVMPVTTPRIKVRAVKALGAEVVLWGDNYSEAAERCAQLTAESGRAFIHPFDDPLVIAGQGTIGHEILQQCPDVDLVFVPVGGGGLISGVASFLKALRPQTRIVGVQPEESNAMGRSIALGRRVTLEQVGLFADGVAVKEVGALTFEMVRAFVDEIITVDTDQICSAIKSIYEETRSIMEPAGALAVAGLTKYLAERPLPGRNVVAVNSGANMNFDRLQFVAERSLTGEKREALFAVTIPERSGALRDLCMKVVGERNITELNYRLSGRDEAHIFVGISIENVEQKRAFEQGLAREGFKSVDLTDDELGKTHIRHMVGGRSNHTCNEVLYRFLFPERPGALTGFLGAMSETWNISLFHYRMHGGDFGHVLVGFEIPAGDEAQFQSFLARLHYAYEDETANPAYRLFL
ncbi:MAG: threonine ammonia-lyase, biosynthetic [Candidatus Lambdaproteobacteria bacterium]|nr:threonine ammonia-lyase, biosynthetic [Candidatus Lambdaproteobacteria bacterium]